MQKTNLFGCGVGCSTCGDFTCGICETEYNKGNDEKEDYSGESVVYTEFAEIYICQNCFDKVEREILRRMADIIPWYKKIATAKMEEAEREKQLIETIFGGIN